MPGKGAIDIVVNLKTPEIVEKYGVVTDDRFRDQIRQEGDQRGAKTVEQYMGMMADANIDHSLLIAARYGDLRVEGSMHLPYHEVEAVCRAHPGKFSGLAGIDPTKGMEGLYELERAVKEQGFIGSHWYPHWFGMTPDCPQIYPYYAKCCELGIPIMMQVGQSLIYSANRRMTSPAKPILLDQVACDFPELKLIGIHIGTPWENEMIAMCWKHENVYMAGDAYAPKHWPKSVVRYADSYGQSKFMFGTDWGVIDPVRAMHDVRQLDFRPKALAKILRNTAINVFSLPFEKMTEDEAAAA
ncbi:MAG: amidohydrolase family protein [Pseudomonadota bacterium]